MESPGKTEGLLGVRTFIIQTNVLYETVEFLKEVGEQGCEGFVLWAGELVNSDEFRFKSALIPEQRALTTEGGLLVVTDGTALFSVNKEAYERGQILGGQVHSHPTEAYHSSTDDDYPMVTLLGALSVVVPDFAKNAPADIGVWAWYRLVDCGLWEPANRNTKVVFE